MSPTKTAQTKRNPIPDKINKRSVEKAFDSEPRLYKFDKHGKIYVPAFIRKLFHGYRFAVYVESGKIVFDPVKIEGNQDD